MEEQRPVKRPLLFFFAWGGSMVYCFLKDPDESQAICKIKKFAMRSWVREDGGADSLVSVVLENDSKSTKPVSSLCLLTTCLDDDCTYKDFSKSLLDPEYYWNTASTHEIQIENHEQRMINYDGIEKVLVPNGLSFGTTIIGKECSLLRVHLNQKVTPGQLVAARFIVGKKRFVGSARKEYLELGMNFMYGSIPKGVVDMRSRQIPVIPIIDEDNSVGGCDVVIVAPQGWDLHDEHPVHVESFTTHDIYGTPFEGPKREARIWRLRSNTRKRATSPNSFGDGFFIKAKIVKKGWYDYVKELEARVELLAQKADLNNLKNEVGNLRKSTGFQMSREQVWRWIGLGIGVASLVLAIIALANS